MFEIQSEHKHKHKQPGSVSVIGYICVLMHKGIHAGPTAPPPLPPESK